MRNESDLTAQARIRDAAIRLVSEHGSEATTIRAVAHAAEVTPGLVSYHFGNKDGLRSACDAFVIGSIDTALQHDTHDRRTPKGDVGSLGEVPSAVWGYAAKLLTDGSAVGAALFDRVVAATVEYLRDQPSLGPTQSDPTAQATFLTAMKLGMWVLHHHLERSINADSSMEQLLSQLALVAEDILSPDFAGGALVESARRVARSPRTSAISQR